MMVVMLAMAMAAAPPAMKPYKAPIPGSDATYEMVPVPGGTFMMGSNGRNDEQPPHQVTVEPFWMGKFEVTWDQYRLFQFATTEKQDAQADAVSHPTRPNIKMSFGMGINGYPAISMTRHRRWKTGRGTPATSTASTPR